MDIRRTDPQSGGRTLTIHATYDELVEAIGEPEDVSDVTDKLDVEWNVRDADTERKLTVWNYKNGPNYQGSDGTPVDQIEKWSAGGDKALAEDLGLDVDGFFS